MNLLPEVESALVDAIHRDRQARDRSGLVAAVRRRLRGHPRALILVLAALVVAGPTFAAVELLQRGSPVGPDVPATPRAFDGVAITSSIRLLPLESPDPVGGPPWGMRTIRTTRGIVCLQVGRLAFGTVGALGRDGAFGNDGRFHPFSPNYETGGPPCPVPDAHGNAFINVAMQGFPANALFGGHGCTPPHPPPSGLPPRLRRQVQQRRKARRGQAPLCPVADLRDIYYGLLGPEAVSITHRTPSGKLVTTPTGRDGAYVIVLRTPPGNQNGSYNYDASLFPGPIRAVHYRDGHTCRPGRCPPVGYVSPTERVPTTAQVASPVKARVELAKVWCVPQDPASSLVPKPCPGRVPAGFRRLRGGPPSAVIVFSFISRIAVTNEHTYYSFTISRPPHHDPRYGPLVCAGAGEGGETNSDYAAGQRVVQWIFENLSCQGIAHGNVTLVTATGPSAPAPIPALPGQSAGREVGHFSVKVP